MFLQYSVYLKRELRPSPGEMGLLPEVPDRSGRLDSDTEVSQLYEFIFLKKPLSFLSQSVELTKGFVTTKVHFQCIKL